ncbi:DUF2236 domain-containing protein [Massilia forsythiae]|uniref:DUF2236 domain-containing protein n=2 Tax=Massilia forsythiae TaxID=2728020 RepID=A0A7Z2W204_9BURK|nr:DUF2236 domain-containing protein [Massilia forsythiae]
MRDGEFTETLDSLPAAGPSWRADPLADAAIARILGPGTGARAGSGDGPDMDLIALLNGQIARWRTNADLDGWRADAGVPAHVAAALEDYVRAARVLPGWADAGQLAGAERLFMDMSMMSVTLLFCASLPECYAVPDLAAVLHTAGQLEQHTDYRVRSTAAMIFPVMMRGGLSTPAGGGVAQAIKVRLIHATIRHLILRGTPQQAVAATDAVVDDASRSPRFARLPRLAPRGPSMQEALYAHGWDSEGRGLPCNQEELAYTLLTFGYVFLRAMRRLGVGAGHDAERAYLHAWNVLGHLLGIERELMPEDMEQAQALFDAIQARARDQARTPDPRPALGQALMAALQRYIPAGLLKPFPVLLARHLCGAAVARTIGLDGHVGRPARIAFALGMGLTRAIDRLARPFFPGFSLARLATRIVGYHFTVRVLMDQTRPLKLPDALLNQVDGVVRAWTHDPQAPRWMNALERRFTVRARAATTQG